MKKFVASMLLSFAGIVQPLRAQSLPTRVNSNVNATFAVSAVRARYADVRLMLPIHSDSSAAKPKQMFDRMLPFPQVGESHRGRNVIIGGVLGAVAGLGVCTVISNVMDDSTKSRVATCTATGNLIFGAGGFAVGALVGAAIK
ncbi:MAG: hypothetical protein ABJB66_17470 [Gemmatimonadaceae bacterium]